jgi:hypothetical protein
MRGVMRRGGRRAAPDNGIIKPRKRQSTGTGCACSRHVLYMIEDKAALLADIRFALRGLDPWPPKGGAVPSEEYAGRVVRHLQLVGWSFKRPTPRQGHSTP